MKLFAVMLGGTAPGANTELHDAVFAVGETIESTYEQLKPYVALNGPTTLVEKVKLPRAPKAAKGSDAPAAKPASNG